MKPGRTGPGGAGGDLFRRVVAAHDAADTDDRYFALSAPASFPTTRLRPWNSGAPERPPAFVGVDAASTPLRPMVVLVATTLSMRVPAQEVGDAGDLFGFEIGAIFSAIGT